MPANTSVLLCAGSTMDPVYSLATPFRPSELKSANKKVLVQPPAYDRTAVLRQCRRVRMRSTGRRMVSVTSRAVVQENSRSESDVAGNTSQTSSSVSQSFADSSVVADREKEDMLIGPELADSKSDVLKSSDQDDSSSGVEQDRRSMEDCWWNDVDSRTWLQGVERYLLLHSAADVKCTTVDSSHSAGTDTVQQRAWPVFSPLRIISGVPVCYLAVVNYTDVQQMCPQQTYATTQPPPPLAAVNLVSFMHSYCLPPTRNNPQCSANLPLGESSETSVTACGEVEQRETSPWLKTSELLTSDGCTSSETSYTVSSNSTDTLSTPGWFGKGLGVKRSKRKYSRQS